MIVGSTSKQIDVGRSLPKNFGSSVRKLQMCLQSVLLQLQQHLFDKNGLLLIPQMLQRAKCILPAPLFHGGFQRLLFLPLVSYISGS